MATDLNLTRRAEKASAVTAGEYDANLDKIEGGFDDLIADKNNFTGTIMAPNGISFDGGVNIFEGGEVGNWTAVLTAGTSGTISLHPAGDTLSYTEIVNRMFFNGQINVSSVSSPIGSLELELPVAVPSLPGGREISGGTVGYSGILPIGTAGALVLYLNAAGTKIKIVEQNTSGYLDNVAEHVQAGAYFWFDFNIVTS